MADLSAEANEAREARRQVAVDGMRRRAETMVARIQNTGRERMAGILQHACNELFLEDNPAMFAMVERMRRVPATIDEFLDSKEFFADQYEELWPQVREDLRAINPDVYQGEAPVHKYFDGGGIGTAKSFRALVTQLYQLYCLTCFDRPQALARLPASTPIIFMFQSTSPVITRRVLYDPFRTMWTSMPYVKRWVPWDKYRENVLYIDQNIQVVPAIASVQAMVGQAIISAILDEVNFMNVIENSKQVPGASGKGGHYDQAEIAYDTITSRRKSRFISKAPIPGCISVASSIKYKGDFLDRKMKQVADDPADETMCFRRAQYEVQPQDKYSTERFRVLVGSDSYATRIVTDDEEAGTHYPENGNVIEVPEDFRQNFVDNPDKALRDIVGIASDSIHPFINQRHKVIEAVVRGREGGLKSWVLNPNVNLQADGMPQIVEANLPSDRDEPRFVHIDLSKNSDRCGIAIVKVAGHLHAQRGGKGGHIETLPQLVVEAAISIQPSVNAELDIAEVRNWVLLLKSFYGFNLAHVSYDGFQSAESIQALRKAGVASSIVSMDRTREPYEDLRRLIYEDRVDMADNEVARLELVNLELNEKTGHIDHPPRGSKDVSDAIAGACYRAARARVNRNKQNIVKADGTPVNEKQGKRRQSKRRKSSRRK